MRGEEERRGGEEEKRGGEERRRIYCKKHGSGARGAESFVKSTVLEMLRKLKSDFDDPCHGARPELKSVRGRPGSGSQRILATLLTSPGKP